MSIKCPKCSAELPDRAKFCGVCGCKLDITEAVVEETPDLPPKTDIAIPVNGKTELPVSSDDPTEIQSPTDEKTELLAVSEAPTEIQSPAAEKTGLVQSEKVSLPGNNSPVAPIVASFQANNTKQSIPAISGIEVPKSKISLKALLAIVSVALVCAAAIITTVILLNTSPAIKTENYLNSAAKYLIEMDYEQAIIAFDKVLEIDPMNVEAYLGKAKALLEMDENEKAHTLLKEGYSKTGSELIFEMLKSINPTEIFSGDSSDDSQPEENVTIEHIKYVYQDPMCLAIEKTLTDYLKGVPITDTTNFDKVTSLTILGNDVYVCCNEHVGAGRVEGGYSFGHDSISYSLVVGDSEEPIARESWNGSLTDISFVQFMTNLKHLDINIEPNLKDLSPLSNSKLQSITVSYCAVEDLTPLSNLRQLNALNLYNNRISDVSAIANCTELVFLQLGHNEISNISMLSEMTKLESFGASQNNIIDMSVVHNFKELEYLGLSDNSISDISAISNCLHLIRLDLHDNNISDISVLSRLVELDELYLGKNNIFDISALYKLKNLKSLSLGKNGIPDAEILRLQETLGIEIY